MLKKKSVSLKLDDLVKHMQEICGFARNVGPVIPRALIVILFVSLSVQCAAADGKAFSVSMSNGARIEKKVQPDSRFLM